MGLVSQRNVALVGGVAVLAGLYITSSFNYLLFHSIAELFAITVACGIFMVAWNSRHFLGNNYIFFIGIAFLFIASIDMIHLMSYEGMSIFRHSGSNIPTQLWISARYMQAITLLAAPLFIGRRLRGGVVFAAYAVASALLIAAIFYWKVFPDCFIEGRGLTPFKIYSEYAISLMLAASIYTLHWKSSFFDHKVVRLLYAAILTTIGAELAFTHYVSVYGFSNLVGHYLKIVSFFLIYKAVIETGLREPYNVLFRELKQSEEALRVSEARYRGLSDAAFEGVIVHTGGKIRDLSSAAAGIFGYEYPSELIGSSMLDLASPEDREDLAKKIAEGYAEPYEMNFLRKDGSIFAGEAHGKTFDYKGNPGRVVAIRDITERKRTEEALRESDERMNRAQEIAHLGSWELDLTNNRLTWSDEVYRIFGLRPQDFGDAYEAFLEAVHPDDRAAVDAAYSNSLREGMDTYDIEHRIVRKESGEVRHVHEKCEHVRDQSGRIIRSLGMVHDITERKKAEEELRTYRIHLEDLVWERTKELQAVNSLLELAGRMSSRKEYLEEVAKLLQEWSECRCVGIRVLGDKGSIPYEAYLGFSREFWESESNLIIDRDHCVCTRVIGGRPEPHEALVMTHFGSFRADNIGEFVASLTEEEKARYRGVCIEHGFKSIAIIPVRYEGRIIAAVHLADEREGKVARGIVEFVENLTPLIGEAINKLDLEKRLKENYAELVFTNEELEREMAERAEAEKQLLQSQKMEAVGQLAGGIAHDFNNRLFAIRNYTHILKTKAVGYEADTLEKILVSCDKAAKLVDDLLKFSRKKEINPRPVNLNNIVSESAGLLRLAAGKKIKLRMEQWDSQLPVMADATQMEHVLINLVTNARDAMPDGGNLTIRTAEEEAGTVSGDLYSGGQSSPFAVIYISDTGPGMDEKTREKIFEPFFTTKDIGKGTGLGLSIVYGVVKQHNGFIEVRSRPGEGATFKIYLPLI